MFVSEYFGLDDELDKMGVFDCVLDNDSRFFINLMRLKVSDVPEFKGAYRALQRKICRKKINNSQIRSRLSFHKKGVL